MSTPTRQLRLAPGPAAYLTMAGGTHGQAALVGYLLDRHRQRWSDALAALRASGWADEYIRLCLAHDPAAWTRMLAHAEPADVGPLCELAEAWASGDRLVREALRGKEW